MPPSPDDAARAEFLARFGREPDGVVRAPGRVNLIGDHTDYNDGFVLPMAIDRSLSVAFGRRSDGEVVVVSDGEIARFGIDAVEHGPPPWSEYVRGVAWSLTASRPAAGWEGVIVSDIPTAAGLSSSAALEIAVAMVFDHLAGGGTPRMDLALAAQRAEREWVGMDCGIMDQMSVAMARSGHALLIDCRDLAYEHVAIPDAVRFVVLDTSTRRELVSSAYNERRAACERAARLLGVPTLREADRAAVEGASAVLDPVDLRRARHVVTENERVLAAADCLRAGDVDRLGALMYESHTSLRDDFSSSSTELDAIVDVAMAAPGCLGARVTGAGFAGCAIAAVTPSDLERFARLVFDGYTAATGITPQIYVCAAADGAKISN